MIDNVPIGPVTLTRMDKKGKWFFIAGVLCSIRQKVDGPRNWLLHLSHNCNSVVTEFDGIDFNTIEEAYVGMIDAARATVRRYRRRIRL